MIDFTHLINSVKDGALLAEVNQELQKLVMGCVECGGKGELKLILKVEPRQGMDGTWTLDIKPSVETKVPKYTTGLGIVYVVTNDKGEPVDFTTQNPKQIKLFEEMNKEK